MIPLEAVIFLSTKKVSITFCFCQVLQHSYFKYSHGCNIVFWKSTVRGNEIVYMVFACAHTHILIFPSSIPPHPPLTFLEMPSSFSSFYKIHSRNVSYLLQLDTFIKPFLELMERGWESKFVLWDTKNRVYCGRTESE